MKQELKTFHFRNYSPLSSQTLRVLSKEEVMKHSGKHDPVPTVLKRVVGIKFNIYISKTIQFFSFLISYVVFVLFSIKYRV